jgi:hypothetical protein
MNHFIKAYRENEYMLCWFFFNLTSYGHSVRRSSKIVFLVLRDHIMNISNIALLLILFFIFYLFMPFVWGNVSQGFTIFLVFLFNLISFFDWDLSVQSCRGEFFSMFPIVTLASFLFIKKRCQSRSYTLLLGR